MPKNVRLSTRGAEKGALGLALSLAVEALRDSRYGPLRQRAAKILQEEECGCLAELAVEKLKMAPTRLASDQLKFAVGRAVQVNVQAPGFEVLGPTSSQLKLDSQQDSAPVVINLRPLEIGAQHTSPEEEKKARGTVEGHWESGEPEFCTDYTICIQVCPQITETCNCTGSTCGSTCSSTCSSTCGSTCGSTCSTCGASCLLCTTPDASCGYPQCP